MIGKVNPSIRIEDIRSRVSDIELLSRYFNINKVPCLVSSPLRKDKSPSFGIYSKDGEKIYWKDFSTEEKGDIYTLLSLLWNCNFEEVLTRIYSELNLKEVTKISLNKGRKSPKYKIGTSNTELKCKVRNWMKHDIEYWNSYGISLYWLNKAEVYPISHGIFTGNGKNYTFKTDKYAYAYVERKEGRVTIKIYQPFNVNGHKWINKHDSSVISLWNLMPDVGNRLAICSSLKDALCLYSNTGIPAIAPQGEGYSISDSALKVIKSRFSNIYIIFDNDAAGIENSNKLAKSTGFKNIILPKFKGGKDISDYYKTYGRTKFIKLFSNLIPEVEDELPF